MEKYLFWGTFAFAYLINGITGFAGNVFAMPVGMATIGHQTSIAVLNCTGFLASLLIAATNWRHIVWREVLKMSCIMAVFMALGAWINTVAPLQVLTKVYGAAILVITIRGLFFNKNDKDLPEPLLYLILGIAGVIQGMFVSGGSFLAIYALQKIRDKQQFRASTCALWTVLNGSYAAFGIAHGDLAGEGWLVLAVCIPLLVMVTLLGGKIQKHISQEQFIKFSYVLLTVVGIVLLVK